MMEREAPAGGRPAGALGGFKAKTGKSLYSPPSLPLQWRIFPVHHKRPLILDWPRAASSDPGQQAEWARDYPRCGWAVATGAASGVIVIDIDGAAGQDGWYALEARHGMAPDTARAYSGSGAGWHEYFRHPGFDVRCSASVLAPGVDVRGDGGSCTVPPSSHASGGRYIWAEGTAPDEIAVAEAPSWLVELLRPKPAPIRVQAPLPDRHDGRRQGYLEGALARACHSVAIAPDGTRNVTLNAEAFALLRLAPDLPASVSMSHLAIAANAAGLDRSEIEATLRSAARARGVHHA